MNILNVSNDPGFGGNKLAAKLNGNNITTALLPSVVGVGSMGHGGLSTGLSRGKTLKRPMAVQFNKYKYIAGANVHRYARPIERLDFQRLSEGPEQQALLYANLHQLLGGGQHNINLLIGLPVEVLQDRSLAASTRSRLRSWLVGDHQFTVDGDQVAISIHQVKTMAQPLGSFFHWGMDQRGDWTQSDDPHAKFAIADIGFNTVDLFVIEDAQINERYTGGDTVGMRRANAHVRSAVRSEYGVRLSMYEADNLIRSYLRKRQAALHHADGSSNIGPMVGQAIATVTGEVASFLSDTWGGGQQFRRLILTGGGAEALRDDLLRLYPHAAIMDNAQMANVVGLAKFAQRKSVFS